MSGVAPLTAAAMCAVARYVMHDLEEIEAQRVLHANVYLPQSAAPIPPPAVPQVQRVSPKSGCEGPLPVPSRCYYETGGAAAMPATPHARHGWRS